MIDPANIPAIADNELLARFIVGSDEKRPDGTVKHKLFLPYRHVELSVNRHREATPDETWKIGFDVAKARQRKLHGMANIRAGHCRIAPLDVIPAPILPQNPNHANISGFPPAKEDQMALAIRLAASIEGQWQSPPQPD